MKNLLIVMLSSVLAVLSAGTASAAGQGASGGKTVNGDPQCESDLALAASLLVTTVAANAEQFPKEFEKLSEIAFEYKVECVGSSIKPLGVKVDTAAKTIELERHLVSLKDYLKGKDGKKALRKHRIEPGTLKRVHLNAALLAHGIAQALRAPNRDHVVLLRTLVLVRNRI